MQALRACWHPVAFADAVTERRTGRCCWTSRWRCGGGRGAAARRLGPLHPSRHGAVAGLDAGRPDRLPVPRLALPGRRQVRGDPAARRPDQGAGQGADRRRSRGRALRADLGGAGGAALRAARRARARGPRRLGRRQRRPVPVAVRRLPPARELHRLRPLPVGASRACSATPSARSCPQHTVDTDGHVLHYPVVRPEAANTRRVPGVRATSRRRRRSAARRYQLHLPYTILLRLGWGGEKGMLYFFASQPVERRASASATS